MPPIPISQPTEPTRLGAAEPSEWPRLLLPAPELQLLRWAPLDCSVLLDQESHLRFGRVVWISEISNQRAGIAWSWAEVQPSVVAVSDPLNIETNIELDEVAGEAMTHHAWMCLLNVVIYTMGWQKRLVATTLSGRSDPSGVSKLLS